MDFLLFPNSFYYFLLGTHIFLLISIIKKPRTGNAGIQGYRTVSVSEPSEAVTVRERQEFKASTKLSHAADSREQQMTAREEMR